MTPQFATTDDIRACFRLLLGREPHAEEWSGHSSRAGEELGAVVSSYVNSLEFRRRGLLEGAEGVPEVAVLEGVRLYASRDDLAVGRVLLAGSYEPEVVAVFRDVLRPGMHVVDVGANIGFFSMLAASIVGPAGSVLAVEPNPRNARMAEASRRLNGFAHVTVLQAAAGRAAGMLAINTSFSNGMTSGIEAEVFGVETVGCVALDQVVPRDRPVAFMKLDVEGAEYNALLGASVLIKRDKPTLVFEFGPTQLPGISGVTGEEMLGWVIGQGYDLAVLRAGALPEPMGADSAAVMRAFTVRGVDHIDVLARPARRLRWFGS